MASNSELRQALELLPLYEARLASLQQDLAVVEDLIVKCKAIIEQAKHAA